MREADTEAIERTGTDHMEEVPKFMSALAMAMVAMVVIIRVGTTHTVVALSLAPASDFAASLAFSAAWPHALALATTRMVTAPDLAHSLCMRPPSITYSPCTTTMITTTISHNTATITEQTTESKTG